MTNKSPVRSNECDEIDKKASRGEREMERQIIAENKWVSVKNGKKIKNRETRQQKAEVHPWIRWSRWESGWQSWKKHYWRTTDIIKKQVGRGIKQSFLNIQVLLLLLLQPLLLISPDSDTAGLKHRTEHESCNQNTKKRQIINKNRKQVRKERTLAILTRC